MDHWLKCPALPDTAISMGSCTSFPPCRCWRQHPILDYQTPDEVYFGTRADELVAVAPESAMPSLRSRTRFLTDGEVPGILMTAAQMESYLLAFARDSEKRRLPFLAPYRSP